jgi:hypothetical protein
VGGDSDLRDIDLRQWAGMYDSGHKRSLVFDAAVDALNALYNNCFAITEP